MKKILRYLCGVLLFTYVLSMFSNAFAEDTVQTVKRFSDVPVNSYAYKEIHELRSLGVTDGIGDNKFGYGKLITRGEFVTFLVKLMAWKPVTPAKGSFTDVQDKKKPWFSAVETALSHGIISKGSGKFRPNDTITREEMIIMIVNSMGYGKLAERMKYLDKPFSDVGTNIGYVTIAKDTGIINGKDALFNPSGKAYKQQAAVMLINLYHGLKRPLIDLNGFYAISSSSQQDKIPQLTSASFGWSSLAYDPVSGGIVINTSRYSLGSNDYYIPTGFTQRLESAKNAGVPALLMIQSKQDTKFTDPAAGLKTGIPEYVLTRPEIYRKLIGDIVSNLKSVTLGSETGSFDGVVIDFEGMKGPVLKQSFTAFLTELKTALNADGKLLYVAVQPLIHPKRSASCFDGYDYRAIGSIADKVILMAHDYITTGLTQADMARGFNITPLTPIEDVYYALEAITDAKKGIQDKSKIMLQISFDWAVLKRKDGKTINSVPARFSLDKFITLLNSGIPISYQYSVDYANPYLKYIDPETGTENTVWYENTDSVMDKIKLAKLFGIQGISLWRLGTIPDYQPDDGRKLGMDIWQNILKEMEKH